MADETTEQAAAPVRKTEVTITLDYPVQAHGDTVNKLTFRRPTGGDIEKAGYPLNLDFGTGDITINEPKMGAMMVLLASVPPSTIKALDAKDWATCAWGIAGFFPPGSQATQ